MTGKRKQLEQRVAYAHRAPSEMPTLACQQGAARSPHHQIWVSRKPKSTPWERKATDDRRPVRTNLHFAFRPQASSLKFQAFLPHERTRSDLIISLIQLLSCGGRERRMPLKSKEDSANAVGVAPMALPLDLAMEVGTPGRKPSS